MENLPRNYEAKGNIIAFIDECHRTQSGKLHKAMKTLMPKATLIGFTGTPLLKSDKPTSLATFGTYIHTYKFNEAVDDGVVVDLRYEARDIDQYLSDKNKIDKFFDLKTKFLTEPAKNKLKQSWATISKLYSSRERLERFVADIIFDMESKPRLASDRGNAMLVANSIYEACRYWEIFQSKGFTKCAVVTSYEPTTQSVRTATSDLNLESEEEYKKKIYEKMLNGKTAQEFENEVKKLFKETPAKMKLLIVVDKLLTGFDAPHATYLYIDKSMKDHDLFQAICRVNRTDSDDKDYGYIIDYMDLFRNIESAIKDYTSEAFDSYDKNDVEGLLKNFYDEAEAEMTGSLAALKDLLSEVKEPKKDSSYIEYFCKKTSEREILYKLTASAARAFSNCCDRLVSHYDYSEKQVKDIRQRIAEYNKIKEFVKLASHDYIDLKAYEADMRYILDTYIHADDSKVISALSNMSLVELLIDGKNFTVDEVLKALNCDDLAKAEIIENNVYYEIVQKQETNEKYYKKLSEELSALIEQRKNNMRDYQEYLNKIVAIAKKVLHPEESKDYPESIRDSAARRAIYDYFNGNEELTLKLDNIIRDNTEPDYKDNVIKKRRVLKNIHSLLNDEKTTEEIFEIVKVQPEYDK